MRLIGLMVGLGILGWLVGFALWGELAGESATWRDILSLMQNGFLGNIQAQPAAVHLSACAGLLAGSLASTLLRKTQTGRTAESKAGQGVSPDSAAPSQSPEPSSRDSGQPVNGDSARLERPGICRVLDLLTLGVLRFYTVPQGHALAVTAFGKYRKSVKPGLSPILSLWGVYQQPWGLVATKERIEPFADELVFTSDGVKCHIDVMICYRIIDPGKALFEVEDYRQGIRQVVQAVLRNECGKLPARSLLSSREKMASTLQSVLSQDAEPWGISVRLVEITQVDISVQQPRNVTA